MVEVLGFVRDVLDVLDVFRHPNSASLERDVVFRTALAFAQVDPLIAWEACKASENDTPENFQENVREGINKIETDLREQEDNKALSDPEAIVKIIKFSKAVETMVQEQEPPENMISSTEISDFNNSNLDARDVLKDNIRKGLQTFLHVLTQQLHCCEGEHFVRLKMDGFFKQIDAQARLFFDAYLSARGIGTRPPWVRSRCIITKCIETPVPNGCGILRTAEDKNEDLNILLAENQQSSDSPKCPSTTLSRVQLGDCHPLKSLAAPTGSLRSLLNRISTNNTLEEAEKTLEVFDPQDKEMICLNLALSLLHLSTSHWKRVSWCLDRKSDEGIFFLKDPATQRITNKTHPYLSYRLHDRHESKDNLNLACDPQLLDFGKLIMEIYLWKRVGPSPKSRTKEELRLHLLNLISSSRFSRRDGMFQQAVKACLNAAGKEAAQDGINKDSLRNYIFEKIVRPLDHYAGFPKFSPDVINDPSSSVVNDPPSTKSKNTQYSYFDYEEQNNNPKDKFSYAQTFLKNMQTFVEEHIKPNMHDDSLPAHLNNKVRIAVIDSGISKHDPLIRRACKTKRIRECRNFSSNEYDDYDDKLGHGTMVTRLLLDVAPGAELFIAKVTSDTDHNGIPKNKLYAITNAINRAVQVWNVDIITMSLTLKEEHPDIDEELEEALDPAQGRNTRKIIFAAAGNNSGGNSERSWPARKEGVIAVHVTDGLGESVNKNPSSEGEICFATLGHDIKHTWYGEDEEDGNDIYISGTSFATPIAAGIAANVMEYARHHVEDLNEERKKRLYSAPCMKEIFKAISKKRGDYYYVQPWTFWDDMKRGGQWRNKSFIPGDPGNIGLALKLIISSI